MKDFVVLTLHFFMKRLKKNEMHYHVYVTVNQLNIQNKHEAVPCKHRYILILFQF